MNLKRFTARTSRDALALVRQQFGDDAVVMSTRPCAEGVEVLAMAPESVHQLEHVAQPRAAAASPTGSLQQRMEQRQQALLEPRLETRKEAPRDLPKEARKETRQDTRQDTRTEGRKDGVRTEPAFDAPASSVQQDVQALEMSTLSFQGYVRDRMLKRRAAESSAAAPVAQVESAMARAARGSAAASASAAALELPVLDDVVLGIDAGSAALAGVAGRGGRGTEPAPQSEQMALLSSELREMRGLIEQRFGALAYMEKLQRQPRQAQLSQKLMEIGFSPALVRKLLEGLPADGDEAAWAASVLERNLATAEREPALEEQGGVYAMVGATGVGKTTSTAKLAAAFATRYGAANLGLITLDAYRVAAHEQLRAYGRILGVPVHTAHDRASLDDLLELLSSKRMVLIDTAGIGQRDSRTKELMEMLSHRSIKRILVLNASAQGETLEDQLIAYRAGTCAGLVLSKIDEAVKLAPALDAVIRHRVKVLAVANGQRVPEDWHRLSAGALVQRAMKAATGSAWKLDEGDVSLIFAGLPHVAAHAAANTGLAAAVA
ncbi:MAG: flagellar biosynthesis protein FlhF [Rubrivivax sp.]|jgi:flagellar biosynthesis protein FlhF|nr:flagellar biosynthesis protein FlhF [Rubrivivax sp.]